jgi:hypothetical protein
MTLPYFCTILIIPPLKRTWTFIWINLNSRHVRDTKFDWNRPDVDSFQIKCKNSFPLCPPPWPSGTTICTSLNLQNVRKVFVNMSYSGSVVLKGKNYDLTKFLHFCDHFPFEEKLAFYLYNLEFPLPKDDLYQVWLKLARWFWRRRFFFSIWKQVNMVFPIVALPDPQGAWFEDTWIYIISESFRVNMTYSGSVLLEKNIFKWPHPIFAFLWLSPL